MKNKTGTSWEWAALSQDWHTRDRWQLACPPRQLEKTLGYPGIGERYHRAKPFVSAAEMRKMIFQGYQEAKPWPQPFLYHKAPSTHAVLSEAPLPDPHPPDSAR